MKKTLLALTLTLAASAAFAQADPGIGSANSTPAPQSLGAKLEKAVLAVTSYTDFMNDNADLAKAKVFHLDREFVRGHVIDFSQLFMDDAMTICYRGTPGEVLKIVGDIMIKSHTDGNYVVPRETKITADTITQGVNLTDEGGSHDINILLKRCK